MAMGLSPLYRHKWIKANYAIFSTVFFKFFLLILWVWLECVIYKDYYVEYIVKSYRKFYMSTRVNVEVLNFVNKRLHKFWYFGAHANWSSITSQCLHIVPVNGLVIYSSVFLCDQKLREYVDDTEDYINIMLDDKQNQLLQMGVMLNTATVIATAAIVVVSLFGMNIHIELMNDPETEQQKRASNINFWDTTLGSAFGCLVLYILAVILGKRSRLLQWWGVCFLVHFITNQKALRQQNR